MLLDYQCISVVSSCLLDVLPGQTKYIISAVGPTHPGHTHLSCFQQSGSLSEDVASGAASFGVGDSPVLCPCTKSGTPSMTFSCSSQRQAWLSV